MKEYIFTVLTNANWIAYRCWNEYILLGIYSPIFILCMGWFIYRWRKLKKQYPKGIDVFVNLDLKDFLVLLLILVYLIFATTNTVILLNSIILYEL